ncbi:hypothetical protein N7495_000641 [Penicillium taxi]|uniref:uncharacterized protein n=1 Tax=Penicillium taxi TaxID=168475 RepID=UPI0025454750|nr:uncharacterized protein N7495_000641 [Penicillium taxi]KAJ5907959.1 hypothetical protein N7495_000641 [Penicillium taxi]
MSLRTPLVSRWLAQSAELLQQSSLRAATRPSSATPLSLLRPQLLNGQISARQTLLASRNYSTRPAPSRPSAQFKFNQPKQRRFNSSGPKSEAKSETNEAGGLTARLRKLTREYGWAALGVYLTLSALDFPFCFMAVRLLGVERIGHFEHAVLESIKGVFPTFWPKKEHAEGESDSSVTAPKDGNASLWTQLVLAYAIHKSLLIFIRVPLTAAITPKVVQVLRQWGWNIGKRTPKTTTKPKSA